MLRGEKWSPAYRGGAGSVDRSHFSGKKWKEREFLHFCALLSTIFLYTSTWVKNKWWWMKKEEKQHQVVEKILVISTPRTRERFRWWPNKVGQTNSCSCLSNLTFVSFHHWSSLAVISNKQGQEHRSTEQQTVSPHPRWQMNFYCCFLRSSHTREINS